MIDVVVDIIGSGIVADPMAIVVDMRRRRVSLVVDVIVRRRVRVTLPVIRGRPVSGRMTMAAMLLCSGGDGGSDGDYTSECHVVLELHEVIRSE
jgi:hypothetical protein